MKLKIIYLLCCCSLQVMAQTITLDECLKAAAENYPLIRKFDLIKKTTELTMQNINKGWLPQLSATAQATLQSDVTALPDALSNMMKAQGGSIEGLRKDQYKIGIDINQTIFDGGSIAKQKEIARLQGDIAQAESEISLYQLRQRINELYFGILLIDERIRLKIDQQALLEANEKRLAAMLKGGTAMECDYNSIKAERLLAVQQTTEMQSQRQTLLQLLSAFIGKNINLLQKPAPIPVSSNTVMRPELKLLNTRLLLADAQQKELNTRLLPKLSLFAQGFYGYPGLNLFDDIMHRQWSINGIVGARISWNIGAFYTHKNERRQNILNKQQTETDREVFLFNNKLEAIQQDEQIGRYAAMLKQDKEIVELRTRVRQSYESKLTHGIIETSALLQEITKENTAKVNQTIHEIEMLKHQYDRKIVYGQ